jgi:hypothetical protein
MAIVYRAMTEANDGFPQTGDTNRTLGVREGEDVTPDEDGVIGPGEGMSVAPEEQYVPPWRSKRDPIWQFQTDELPADLQYAQDSAWHGLIEAAGPMPLDGYREMLAETRERWFSA